MTARDWWAMTMARDPTVVEWDMKSGEVRARDPQVTNWVYGKSVNKATYALSIGYGMLREVKNADNTLPVPHLHGSTDC